MKFTTVKHGLSELSLFDVPNRHVSAQAHGQMMINLSGLLSKESLIRKDLFV